MVRIDLILVDMSLRGRLQAFVFLENEIVLVMHLLRISVKL